MTGSWAIENTYHNIFPYTFAKVQLNFKAPFEYKKQPLEGDFCLRRPTTKVLYNFKFKENSVNKFWIHICNNVISAHPIKPPHSAVVIINFTNPPCSARPHEFVKLKAGQDNRRNPKSGNQIKIGAQQTSDFSSLKLYQIGSDSVFLFLILIGVLWSAIFVFASFSWRSGLRTFSLIYIFGEEQNRALYIS